MKINKAISILALVLAGSLAVGGCANPSTLTRDLSTVSTVDGSDGKWYRSAGDVYDYPMTPEKTPDQWKAMTNVKDRLAAQNLPDDVLASISTVGLVETVINHVFYANYLNFTPNYLGGVERTLNSFNGYIELLKRKDAATEFIRFYMGINVDTLCTNVKSPYFRLGFIELLLAHSTFIDQMTEGERSILMNAVLRNVHSKDRYFTPGHTASVSSVLLLGRLLEKESPDYLKQLAADEVMKTFIATGSMDESIVVYKYRDYIRDVIEPIVTSVK